MLPYVVLGAQLVLTVAGVVGLGWWLRRRLPARWSTWGWGALAFVGSQAARLPLLIAITIGSQPYFTGTDPDVLFWINFVILTTTSGLFEETARYLVLRWGARRARRWEDGVMFGAGHGGIEALLILGTAVVSSLALLIMGDTLLAGTTSAAPEQAAALAAQIEVLRTLPWWAPLPALWERVLAITFHISASLLVLRAVIERRVRWWAMAALWHAAFNAIALLGMRYIGLVGTELALTLGTALSIAIIVRARRWAWPAASAADVPPPGLGALLAQALPDELARAGAEPQQQRADKAHN